MTAEPEDLPPAPVRFDWREHPALREVAEDWQRHAGGRTSTWDELCERYPQLRPIVDAMSHAEVHRVLFGDWPEGHEEQAPSTDVPVRLLEPDERAEREARAEPPATGLAAWMPSLCQLGGSPIGRRVVPDDTPPPIMLPYRCPDPSCVRGRWPDGQRCMCCNGAAYVTAEQGEPWLDEGQQLEPAPTPPGIMRNPCPGCALRPGSVERSMGADPPLGKVFWCHKGMEQDADGNYLPAMEYMGVPIGYLICRGWYNAATGTGTQPDDLEPYREEKLPALPPAGPVASAASE